MTDAVLILETEPQAELLINEVLSAADMEVYAADTVTSLIRALQATAFPLVVIDAAAPGFLLGPTVAMVHEAQPDTAVILTGRHATPADLVEMLRAGCYDFVGKPFDPAALASSARAAIERRRRFRGRVRALERRVRAAEASAREQSSGSAPNSMPMVKVSDFADFALQRILALEERIEEMQAQLRTATGGAAEAPPRPAVETWIVHSDPEFAAGVSSLAPRLNLETPPPMSTGGELLDRLSSREPGIIVLDGALPDIPVEFVSQTVRGEHPDVQIVVVDGWGSERRTVALHAGASAEQPRPMATVQDLLDALAAAAERASDRARGRGFAVEFKKRNEELLRRIAEIKRLAL